MERVIVCAVDLVFIREATLKCLNTIVMCHGCGKKLCLECFG